MDKLQKLLLQSHYDKRKTKFLIDGFRNGFSLGYKGPKEVKWTSQNLRLRVGSKTELWNKVMKEVKAKRYAGPFEEIPFDNYIQSPIGLVPKDNGTKTRLIFHLSHPRNGKNESVNANTPEELCKVKYSDFDEAVIRCIEEGIGCKIAKSDMTSAFRNLGIRKDQRFLLIMKAESPINGKTYYFVDKCLPFGAAISCAIFQAFSNAVAHLVKFRTKKQVINYLDDYFFTALTKLLCDMQVQTFLDICKEINFPVSLDKTFWGMTQLVFLGLLIDTVARIITIPKEKIEKGIELITTILSSKKGKITVHQLQRLCGFLNFLGKAIIPGRVFTRRLYSLNNPNLKPLHHVKLNGEMKMDLETWLIFLEHPTVYARPFMDFNKSWEANELNFYTDASKIGLGRFCDGDWMHARWDDEFMAANPSIEYLELYAVTVGVLSWIHRFKNKRVILFCDNMSAVDMINSSSSSTCKNCMVLLRLIVLHGLIHNVRIHAKHVKGSSNNLADSLSRDDLQRFHKLVKDNGITISKYNTPVPEQIWPVEKIWYTI